VFIAVNQIFIQNAFLDICTSDACTKDGKAMVFPKYPTTAIIDNAAEVMETNSILSQALEDALQTIEQQKQEY